MVTGDSNDNFGAVLKDFGKRKRGGENGFGRLTQDQRDLLDQAYRNPLFATNPRKLDRQALFLPDICPGEYDWYANECEPSDDEMQVTDDEMCTSCLELNERCSQCKIEDEYYMSERERALRARKLIEEHQSKLKSKKAKSKGKTKRRGAKKRKKASPAASKMEVEEPPMNTNDIEAKAKYDNFLLGLKFRSNDPDAPRPGCSKWPDYVPMTCFGDESDGDTECQLDNQDLPFGLKAFQEILYGTSRRYSF